MPNSRHVANRSGLNAPKRVGGATTANSFTPAACARHGGHQHGRGIRRRAAGDADPYAIQRPIALTQAAAGHVHADVAVQDRPLKVVDPLADAADRGQKLRIGRGMGAVQFRGGDANVSGVSSRRSIRRE